MNGNPHRKESVMKKSYKIEVDCANCANKMEEESCPSCSINKKQCDGHYQGNNDSRQHISLLFVHTFPYLMNVV